jgi:hypothetical protein
MRHLCPARRREREREGAGEAGGLEVNIRFHKLRKLPLNYLTSRSITYGLNGIKTISC